MAVKTKGRFIDPMLLLRTDAFDYNLLQDQLKFMATGPSRSGYWRQITGALAP